jgi:hypothetical protein
MLLNMLLKAPTPPSSDLLHDTAFQFIVLAIVTIIAGAIGGIITYWIFRKQRIKKEISYQIISDAPIASINKEVADRVEVTFDGKPVKDMSLLVLKIWNSGNVAVKTEDYFEPINYEFAGRTVVGSDLLSTEPEDLIDPKVIGTFLTQGQESIELPKFPFNSMETISLKILLTGSKGEICRRGRIADGKIIEYDPVIQRGKIRKIQRRSLISVFSLMIIFLLGGTLLFQVFNIKNNIFSTTFIIIIIILFFMFFILYTLGKII